MSEWRQGEADPTLVEPGAAISLEYLLTAAAWQDSLLQSYRALLLSSQSIVFAIGVGLFIAELSFDTAGRAYLAAAILLFTGAAGLYTTLRLRQVVLARGRDVNYWHEKIILTENLLPPHQRPFTEFKVRQRFHRAGLDDLFLSESSIEPRDVQQLVDKGLGHTRRVVDQHVTQLLAGGWCLLLAAGTAYAVYVGVVGF